MNPVVLDILFVVVGILTVLLCIKRGFFKTVMRFCRILFALLAAYFLGSKLAGWLSTHIFYKPIHTSVYQKLEKIYQDATEGFDAEKIISAFPRFLMNDSMKNEINGMEESGEALVERASNSVASALSGIVSSIIGYVVVFVVALLLLIIVTALLAKLIHIIPLMNLVDRILGGLIGVLIAFCILYLTGTAIRFFWGETDFYAKSSVVRFFGNIKVPKVLSFLDFNTFLSKVFSKS